MGIRLKCWLIIGFAWVWVALLLGPSVWVTAQGNDSCRTCHEGQGKKPISQPDDWHTQHIDSVRCAICHGGNPQEIEADKAHAGVLRNPLGEAENRCGICHPDDFVDRANQYARLIPAITATAAPVTVPTDRPAVEPAQPLTSTQGQPPPIAPTLSMTATSQPSTQAPSNTPTAAGGVDWLGVLKFARGPLFRVACLVFVVGMLLRLIQVLRPGWKHKTAKIGKLAGVGVSFLKGLLILPFIPWVKGTFRRSPVMYLAGGLFHLGLLTVIFFSQTHILAWKSVVGFGWPALPGLAIDWLAAIGIVAMLALLINRLISPVLRLISGPAEWLNWAFVFLPMITGFLMAQKLWQPYEVAFSVHILLVDALLIWIPFSRISHFVFYFFSRAIHGVEFESRRSVA